MIKKRAMTNGVNANVSLEPSSASQSTSNINNNIYITKKIEAPDLEKELEKEDIIITRNVELDEIKEDTVDVREIILETYAKILLSQDKALLSNLIFKKCIIVPLNDLANIIKAMLKNCEVEVFLDEDIKCCATKANPIRKVEAIKIVKEDGEIITDFKQVYNKEFNELVNVYHLCLKYAVYQ